MELDEGSILGTMVSTDGGMAASFTYAPGTFVPGEGNFDIYSNPAQELGLEVKTGVGGHGVIGILRGDKPGKTVVLRSDMDAPPIEDGKSASTNRRCK